MSYGPLSYSLAIKERWEKYGKRNAKWPEWEVFPTIGDGPDARERPAPAKP